MAVLHVHMGVDSVFENIVSQAFGKPVARSAQTPILVSSDFFDKNLKYVLDKDDLSLAADARERLMSLGSSLVISRPRFLFSGRPMNMMAAGSKVFNKIDSLQKLLPDYFFVVHLLVTDHFYYLPRHANKVDEAPETVDCSWQPLIRGVHSRLGGKGELRVWSCDPGEGGELRFLSQGLGLQTDWKPPAKNAQHSEWAETFDKIRAKGWSAEALHSAYEVDREVLNF